MKLSAGSCPGFCSIVSKLFFQKKTYQPFPKLFHRFLTDRSPYFRPGVIRTAAAVRNAAQSRSWKKHPVKNMGDCSTFPLPPANNSGNCMLSPVIPEIAAENTVTGEDIRSQRKASGAEAIPCIR